MSQIALTFAIAMIGVLVSMLIGLPLPWLLGPIFACLFAALVGVRLVGIRSLNESMRTILGVAVGATLTPQVVATFPAMWTTLILVPIMILFIGALGIPYFAKLWRYDLTTAYYATMPGGLQDMLVLGEEAGGSVRSLSLIHATRVLVIVISLPFILSDVWGVSLDTLPGRPLATIPWEQIAIMIVCAVVGWRTAKWVGMFGASILGPLIVAAIAAQFSLLENRPPAEAIWVAQFFIGMTIGSKYVGITLKEARHDLVSGLGFCAILILLTLVFVEGIYAFALANDVDALLAFAPGGQAELAVLALVVGADVAFVVAHHVVRLFIVILFAPLVIKFFQRIYYD